MLQIDLFEIEPIQFDLLTKNIYLGHICVTPELRVLQSTLVFVIGRKAISFPSKNGYPQMLFVEFFTPKIAAPYSKKMKIVKN